MGFIVFEEEAFNYLDAQLENFVKRMDRIRERSEDKTMNKWLDTQDVCQTLNICPRTVQMLRDNGTLAYTQISHKTYYKPEDMMNIAANDQLDDWCNDSLKWLQDTFGKENVDVEQGYFDVHGGAGVQEDSPQTKLAIQR